VWPTIDQRGFSFSAMPSPSAKLHAVLTWKQAREKRFCARDREKEQRWLFVRALIELEKLSRPEKGAFRPGQLERPEW
jgi:hypothetical protein